MLGFAALAAIPVVIHILSRLRLRRAEFPSLMLLQAVRRERFSWLRLKELLLLIFRTLALLALLLALARPFIKQRLAGLGRANDLILVIDDSYSMGYSGRWQQALGTARELLGSLGAGRRGLVLTSSGSIDSGEFLSGPVLLRSVDSLEPSFSAATLEQALTRATGLAEKSGADVVVLTDLQERDIPAKWQVTSGRPVTLFDVGGPGFDNAGVTRVYPEERFAAAGRPVRIKADIANFGSREVTRTAVLEVGTRREEKVVVLKPKSVATVEFDTPVGDSGTHSVRVELRPDSLAADDRRWFVADFPAQIRVLVVQSERVPARYIVDALGPDSASALRLSVVDAAEFGRQDLRRQGVVVLTDASAFSRADWTRLEYFLQSGGAALVMAGRPPADSAAIGRYFGASGRSGTAGFLSVQAVDTIHPVFQVLSSSDLGASRFFGPSRISSAGARVLVEAADGTPLVLETAEGRLVVWAFSAAPEFTDLVYKAAFVPLLHRTLYHLASAPLRLDYTVGDTIRLPVDEAGPVTVVAPQGRFNVMPVSRLGRPEVVFTNTRVPGVYSVGGRLVAVNPEPGQGDLMQAELKRLTGSGFEVRKENAAASADLVPILLWLAAIAFAAEMLLLAV